MKDTMPGKQEKEAPCSFVAHKGKWSGLFLFSAGGLLFVTGTAKIVSALGKSAILAKPDPIFGIPFNWLLLSVGLIELAIAVLCLTSTRRERALGLVAALSINFLVYRMALWLVGWHGYCPCLGTLTQAIHLSRHSANLLTQMILIYLISGSCCFLAYSWITIRLKRRVISNA